MPTDPSVFSYFVTWFWAAGEVAFKWIPGAAISIALPQDPMAPHVSFPVYSQPVTFPQAIEYFQVTATPGVADFIFYWWTMYFVFAVIFSLLFGTLLVNSVMRILRLRKIEYEFYEGHHATVAAADIPRTKLRWLNLEDQMNSDEPQNWRLAVLEADVMLNELLDLQGYRGETIADKLRAVDRTKFHTIDEAWEAHLARDEVAHTNQEEAQDHSEYQRIFKLYEKVFREFELID